MLCIAAALFSERRSFLYLGGILGSGLSFLLLVRLASPSHLTHRVADWWRFCTRTHTQASFANIFFRSESLFNLNLYGGLLLFVGSVTFIPSPFCVCL